MGEGARAMDSVVLAGAKVGAGAILGRCIVGPGAVVPAGARVVDEIIRGREARRELGREVEREELRS
jgi:ADP-glucose pyrophosphorylase